MNVVSKMPPVAFQTIFGLSWSASYDPSRCEKAKWLTLRVTRVSYGATGPVLVWVVPSRSHHYYPQMSGRHLSMLDLGTGGLEASANCLSATHAGRVRLFRVYYWGYRLETQSPSSLLPSTNGLHDDLSEQDDDRNSRIIGSILRTVQLGLMPNNSLDSGIPNAQHQLMQEPASLRR
jgi:hypothetical protein